MKFKYTNPVLVVWFMALFLAWSWWPQTRALAETGIGKKTITLGQSCALTGPARHLGWGMRAGLSAAFEEINSHGGIKGKKLVLVSRDDYYEPGQASRNSEALICQDQVFMLIGQVGTPTARAAMAMAERYGTPFFAPYSGANFLRIPFNRNIINLRASYHQEMARLVDYLVIGKKAERIACFYQDDSFGQSVFNGVITAMENHNLKVVAQGCFQRNTIAVMAGLRSIMNASPDAVILVGTHPPCVEFIKLALAKGMTHTLFATTSFAGTQTMAMALGDLDQEVITSQVMPYPFGPNLPIISDYLFAMADFAPQEEISHSSFEGYVAARLFAAIAESVPLDLTRGTFIETLEAQVDLNLGGLKLSFGPKDHQGMDQTYILVIKNREMRPIQ